MPFLGNGPNKKKCVSGNMSENFRYGRHTFILKKKILEKKYNFMHFERHFAFQNAYNYIFSRKPEKMLVFTSKFR